MQQFKPGCTVGWGLCLCFLGTVSEASVVPRPRHSAALASRSQVSQWGHSVDVATEWRGFDISQLSNDDDNGATPPFRREPGSAKEDALVMLKESGGNTFRMRVWNDPCADHRPGCNATQCAYASPKGVLRMGARCHAAGLKYVVDFHYSDWWADPGKQHKPTEWKHLDFDDLAEAVYNFTYKVVHDLVEQGTPPAAVQIGNEISNGMLWANESIGEPCSSGGKLFCADKTTNWKQFGRLVARGIDAVRAASPTSEVAIHTDLGNHVMTDGIDYLISWYTSLANAVAPAKFDRIGLSMYPQFDQGKTFESVAQLPRLARAFPALPIYIAETVYPADGPTHPEAKFNATPSGQLDYLLALRRAAATALPQAQFGGVLWWEGSETSWVSLLDQNYVARPALLHGFAELN